MNSARAFAEQQVPFTFENIGEAIGAFERTLLTPSRFDAFLSGDEETLSAADALGIGGVRSVPPDLKSVEREHIVSVLNECNWKISGMRGAASRLEVPPSTLRSKMKRLGIERPA